MILPSYPLGDIILRSCILGPLALIWVTLFVRFNGLRTFSKMTAFDFIATIATGSLLANAATAVSWQAFFQPCIAIAAVLLCQALFAKLIRKHAAVGQLLQNDSLMLMRKGNYDREAMEKTRVTEGEILSKLREANVLKMEDVQAVVLEPTGDISVLHGDELNPEILKTVRNKQLLDAES